MISLERLHEELQKTDIFAARVLREAIDEANNDSHVIDNVALVILILSTRLGNMDKAMLQLKSSSEGRLAYLENEIETRRTRLNET
jgi:hypothetical protein